jgi:hypothetical protein
MLHDVIPRERGAGPLVERLRYLPAAERVEKCFEVRADRTGGTSWFIYGAYQAARTGPVCQAGGS